MGDERREEAQKLQERIAQLSTRLDESGTIASLRSAWSRVTGWIQERPGQARPGSGISAEAETDS